VSASAAGGGAAEPLLSIVIPVYNEEGILRGSVLELEDKLRRFGWSYELLLCENGSRDRTVEIGKEIEAEHPEVRLLSTGQPNYGLALKTGILAARGDFVICDEIDLCDTDFYQRALMLLEADQADLVIGSKVMSGADDRRPMMRHAATLVINGMLRVLVGFHGTDTHGLKAFRREALLETARRCVLDRDVFASEFVIRAHREGKKVVEIPFAVREKRPPSINLVKRVPHVVKSVAKLAISVRRNET
jgi:glycosyltransferase involved in cell wall biosynthesis